MLDRNQIEFDANTVLTNEILGSIIVPEARPRDECQVCAGRGILDGFSEKALNMGQPPEIDCPRCEGTGKIVIEPKYFPPIDRPLQERSDWWKHRGVIKNPDDRYTYYYAIAKQAKPYLIAEVGVFYGYSLMALAKGALAGGSPVVAVNGFDNEQYAPGCLEWARQGFLDERIGCNLMHADSQQLESFPLSMIQLASIDGDHSYASAMNDLIKMEKCMVPRPRLDAIYIVDDIGWALNVRQAAEDFAVKFGYQCQYYPVHKGLMTLERT